MSSALSQSDLHESDLFFGPFEVRRAQKLLLEDGKPVRIGSRAFDVLLALVERPGTVLSQEALVQRVWPTTVVEDTSLRFHISSLRKALRDGQDGARYIANIPGRGYSFVGVVRAPALQGTQPVVVAAFPSLPAHLGAPVSPSLPCAPRAIVPVPPAAHGAAAPWNNLPPRLTPVVGRDDSMRLVASLLTQRRLVSIVGPGGIGKTTVAMEVAKARGGQFPDGALLVDFSDVTDPAHLPLVLARVVGAVDAAADGAPAAASHDPLLASVQQRLGSRRMLLIFDNCEHVLEAATALAEAVLKAVPMVAVLATSREPLDAEGEWVHRMAGLSCPASGAGLSVAQATGFDAIRLLAERAQAHAHDFVLSEHNLPDVVHLCELLEGNPLALELAAGRVAMLGVGGLLARADSLPHLLARGRRTAGSRHGSLMASLEWSHGLLDPAERTVLRRLAVLQGYFDLATATAMAGGLVAQGADWRPVDAPEVIDCVLRLTTKSLLVVDAASGPRRFRLPHATRCLAASRLEACGERPALQRRHALHFCAWLDALTAPGSAVPPPGAVEQLRPDVDAALAWASSAGGDAALAMALSDGLEAVLARRTGVPVRVPAPLAPRTPHAAASPAVPRAGTVTHTG